MKKTKLELLQKALTVLKNAARARKEELAFLAGFDNVVDYKANLIARIAAEETADVKSEEEPAQEGLNMVLAFDCTASMNDWIVAVREHAKQTITEIFENQPDAKIKVIAFGDYCDMKSETEFGKAYQESELSNDVDYLVDFINNTKNTYGGDSDEFYELVIKKIVEETKWDSSRRSVLLIGDAAPHAVGYRHINCKGNQIDWRKECKKAADAGITIDTLMCGTGALDFYREVSEITQGLNLPFRSQGKTKELIKGVMYARSGNTAAFEGTMSTLNASDTELIGTYKSLASIL